MRKKIVALIMVSIMLLCACGRQEAETEQEHVLEPTSEQNVDEEEKAVRWEFREALLPDADEALEAAMPELGRSREVACDIEDGVLYRVMSLSDNELVDEGICIQILEPPYTEWENIHIPNNEWLDGQSIYVRTESIRPDGSICLLLKGLSDDGCYRAQWGREDGIAAERIPDEFLNPCSRCFDEFH